MVQLHLLWQINDVPGLEVQDLKGNWHPVPYAQMVWFVTLAIYYSDGQMIILKALNIE